MKLKKYLEYYGIRMTTFAKRCGVPYCAIRTIAEGGDFFFSIAKNIIRETGGEVTWDDLEPKVHKKHVERMKRLKATVIHSQSNNSDDSGKDDDDEQPKCRLVF